MDSTDLRDNALVAHAGINTENAMVPTPNMANNLEKNKNIRGQSKSIEKISLGNETDQEVQISSMDGNKVVSVQRAGSSANGIRSSDNIVGVNAGMNADTENAMLPKPDMVNAPEKNKNIRGQSKSIEKISLGNETDQEVQISSTNGNRVVSAHGSSPAVNSINPKNNISFDKDTVKGVALSEIGGLLGNTQDSAVYECRYGKGDDGERKRLKASRRDSD